jgi:parallel beta-helix repeat protein
MGKNPFILVSICAVVLLVMGSLSNVVGYQTQDIENQSSASRGNLLYVGGSGPGNYTRIQDAIDNSSDGDTVFVYDDSSPYKESLLIDKSLLIIGENKQTTIIEWNESQYAIIFQANNINLTNFTIQNCVDAIVNNGNISSINIFNNIINKNNRGISLLNCNNINIINNYFTNNSFGIVIRSAKNIFISSNCIKFNVQGISIDGSENGIISFNDIELNIDNGIAIYNYPLNKFILHNYHLYSNNISKNYRACLFDDESCSFENNSIESNTVGIIILYCESCVFYHNDLKNNSIAFRCNNGFNNKLIKNNFINNLEDATFHISNGKLRLCNFRNNYWEKPLLNPKRITGNLSIFIPYIISIDVPWIKFDWFPAQEPYDILEMN